MKKLEFTNKRQSVIGFYLSDKYETPSFVRLTPAGQPGSVITRMVPDNYELSNNVQNLLALKPVPIEIKEVPCEPIIIPKGVETKLVEKPKVVEKVKEPEGEVLEAASDSAEIEQEAIAAAIEDEPAAEIKIPTAAAPEKEILSPKKAKKRRKK